MMTSAVIHATRPDQESAVSQIPASVLIIGKKRASEYLAPALFRIGSTGSLEIRARGGLNIVTAVDVAELVKRNVTHLATQSITVGTDEILIDGINRRISTIVIALEKEEMQARRPSIVAPAAPVVEQNPADLAEMILGSSQITPPEAEQEPKAPRKRASSATTRKKSTKAGAKKKAGVKSA